MSNAIGKIGQTATISAGLFWPDCAGLGAQVQELEAQLQREVLQLEGVLG